MKNLKKIICLLVAGAFLFSINGCGLNPFGSAMAGGLKIFALVGKAMKKPSQINDEEQKKENISGNVNEGAGSAKRLANKSLRDALKPLWLDSCGASYNLGTQRWTYWENVTNKPSEEDSAKLVTGRGEVQFKYTGILDWPNVVAGYISDIYSWHFMGRENKTWKAEICSVDVMITFSTTTIGDIKPGTTSAWGKNISLSIEAGQGDTASFILDSLDDVNHIQFGEGHFLDAHTGKDNTEGPKDFNFNLQVIHKNSLEPTKPYLRYQDNEGIVSFTLPWEKGTADSLYFNIHFLPNYDRSGEIRENNADGLLRVRFTHNEKTNVGTITYYNEKGEEVATE